MSALLNVDLFQMNDLCCVFLAPLLYFWLTPNEWSVGLEFDINKVSCSGVSCTSLTTRVVKITVNTMMMSRGGYRRRKAAVGGGTILVVYFIM